MSTVRRVLVLCLAVVTAMVPHLTATGVAGQAGPVAGISGVLGLGQWDGVADGSGLIIAFVDTGIDPSHPALSTTAQGGPRIVDWQDFTGRGTPEERALGTGNFYLAEGDVPLHYQSQSGGDFLSTVRGSVRLGGVRSVSGVYRYGFFRESQVDDGGPLGQDLDHNGRAGDEYLVVAVDSSRAGVYDVVYVDTRQTYDLGDETALRVFPHRVGRLGQSGGPQTPFVVTHITSDGRLVNLGFDGNGHGTHVAGIAAAWDAGGTITGVAPGVEIMALKALRSSGDGGWDSIARAVEYAALQGANIVSISVGGAGSRDQIAAEESRVLSEIASRHGILIVVAAGNAGPGTGTVSSPGDPGLVLTAGAVMSPETWKTVYGYAVEGTYLYPYSGQGPRPDGSPAPSLVAPGAAVSTVPLWSSADGLGIMEGTSIAVPYVAAAAALLWDAGQRAGVPVTASSIKRALEMGARPLDGIGPLEAGAGHLDVGGAWEWLLGFGGTRSPLVSASSEPGIVDGGHGPPQRSTDPLRLPPGADVWWITGQDEWAVVLDLRASGDALSTQPFIVLPPGVPRRLDVEYRAGLDDPGLHTAWLTGAHDPSDPALELLHAWVEPLTMTAEEGYRVTVDDVLPAGGLGRYYVKVPPGANRFTVSIAIPADNHGPLGRLRLFVIDPRGRSWVNTGWMGRGSGALSSPWEWNVEGPTPGIWEVVAYSSPGLSLQDLDDSRFTLDASIRDVRESPAVIHLTPTGDDGLYGASLEWQWSGRGILEPVALGMSRDSMPRGEQLLGIKPGDSLFREIIVPANTKYLDIGAINPYPSGTAVDVFLYYYDPRTGLPHEVSRSGDVPGRILLENPAPGRYGAWVEVGQFHGTDGTLQFFWRAMVDDEGLQAEVDGDNLILTAAAPVRRTERLYGTVAWFSSHTGQIVDLSTVILEPGEEYLVSLPTTRLPAGPGRQVTIQVRDAATMMPASVSMDVNGRLYHAVDGRLALTFDLEMPGAELVVTLLPSGDTVPARPRVFFIDAYLPD